MRGFATGTVVMLLAMAAPATAQEAGDVGLTMGYPAAVGVIWHITDAIAVRPELTVSTSTTESTSTTSGFGGGANLVSTTTSTSWTTSVGLSALFYVKTLDRVRLYIAPRAAYLRTSIDIDDDQPLAGSFDNSSSGFVAAGAFGAQYGAHERFAIFGEVGAQYTSQSSTSAFSITRNRSESRTAGLRSAVGVTLYF
jgi:hypothetical protein